jgi:hypothetical protein
VPLTRAPGRPAISEILYIFDQLLGYSMNAVAMGNAV